VSQNARLSSRFLRPAVRLKLLLGAFLEMKDTAHLQFLFFLWWCLLRSRPATPLRAILNLHTVRGTRNIVISRGLFREMGFCKGNRASGRRSIALRFDHLSPPASSRRPLWKG